IFEAGITSGRAVCGLPTEACALKLVELPRAAKAELARMVRYEAELQMPLPLADMAWGYQVYDSSETARPALIAGIRREAADETASMAEAAHLEATIITFAMAAAVRSVGSASNDAGPVMILDIGRERINIGIAGHGNLVYSRSVQQSMELEGSMETWLNEAAAEMKRSIFSLAAGGSLAIPGRAVVVGEYASVSGLCERLSELSEMEVTAGNPWPGMSVAETVVKGDATDPAAYAVATGLALMGFDGRGYINLLPGHRLEERVARRRNSIMLSGLGAAALLLSFVLMSGHGALTDKAAELRETRTQLQEARAAMRGTEPAAGTSVDTLRRRIDGIKSRETSPLELLRLLSLEMPSGVWLTELSYEKDKSLTIKGKGHTNAAIAAVVGRLSEAGFFHSVTLDYSNQEQDDVAVNYDFRITCSWLKNKGTLRSETRADDSRKTGITVQ
ncbi:MAG: pilus assembly protein PilM, partial [bacterium]|nr:pilus assembly protein PilM [bacterium]